MELEELPACPKYQVSGLSTGQQFIGISSAEKRPLLNETARKKRAVCYMKSTNPYLSALNIEAVLGDIHVRS